MDVSESIVQQVTKSPSRQSLYHFTRVSNLQSISLWDTLYSSNQIAPALSVQRRTESQQVEFQGQLATVNAHLRIANTVMHPDTTQLEFRTHLDQHVFFWPTLRDVQAMIQTYTRREPEEGFVILQFNAYSFMLDNFNHIKLSKYDSGSSPRFPNRCSYKKSLAMFLPLEHFGAKPDPLVPNKPSEIREVLVHGEVANLTTHLQTVYCDHEEAVPECWKTSWSPFVPDN